MSKYIIQASPLSKLFQRAYQAQCKKDFNFLKHGFDIDEHLQVDENGNAIAGTPFTVTVPRTFGALKFTHNKPVLTGEILPKRKGIKEQEHNPIIEDDVVHWLLEKRETDVFGIVDLPVAFDVTSIISGLMSMPAEESKKGFAELQKDFVSDIRKGIESARARADERVLTQMRMTHNNLLKQYEALKQDGKGTYTPSLCEIIGAEILDTELKKLNSENQNMMARFNNNMGTMMGA